MSVSLSDRPRVGERPTHQDHAADAPPGEEADPGDTIRAAEPSGLAALCVRDLYDEVRRRLSRKGYIWD